MRFGERAVVLAGAAGRLFGWQPDEFWNATPAELATVLAGGEPAEPVASDELSALMARFPDERK